VALDQGTKKKRTCAFALGANLYEQIFAVTKKMNGNQAALNISQTELSEKLSALKHPYSVSELDIED
jgi:hypothetical protein